MEDKGSGRALLMLQQCASEIVRFNREAVKAYEQAGDRDEEQRSICCKHVKMKMVACRAGPICDLALDAANKRLRAWLAELPCCSYCTVVVSYSTPRNPYLQL